MSAYKTLLAYIRAEEIYQRKKIERAMNPYRAMMREWDRLTRFSQPDISEDDGIPDPEEIAEVRIQAEEQTEYRRSIQAEAGRRGAIIKHEKQIESQQQRHAAIRKRYSVLKEAGNVSAATITANEFGIHPDSVRRICRKRNNPDI